MTPQIFNNRRIIWESKAKQVGVISVSFLFVAAAIWTRDQSSSFMFWGSILFWGGGGMMLLHKLLNPKNLFVTHSSALGKQLIAEEFKAAQASLGPFSYDVGGFPANGRTRCCSLCLERLRICLWLQERRVRHR
jgi:hypothetical protein